MKFFNMLYGQKLILIKTNRPTLPPCPVLAQRAAQITPAYQTLIIWLLCAIVNAISCIRDYWPPAIWTENRSKVMILVILAGVLGAVILEGIANDYVSKVLGL